MCVNVRAWIWHWEEAQELMGNAHLNSNILRDCMVYPRTDVSSSKLWGNISFILYYFSTGHLRITRVVWRDLYKLKCIQSVVYKCLIAIKAVSKWKALGHSCGMENQAVILQNCMNWELPLDISKVLLRGWRDKLAPTGQGIRGQNSNKSNQGSYLLPSLLSFLF